MYTFEKGLAMTNTPQESNEQDSEKKEIREFGTVPIYFKGNTEIPLITITPAIRYATYPDEDPAEVSLYFTPEDYEEMGLIPAQLMTGEFAKDGRTGEQWRSVEKTGAESPSYRISLGASVLETLGIDPQDAEDELVTIYAGEGVLAFARPDMKEITIDSDIDIFDLLGPEASRDYEAVVVDRRDPETVAEEHGRRVEFIEENVRIAKQRKQELEEAGIDI